MLSEGLYKVKVVKKRDSWGLSKTRNGSMQLHLQIEVREAADEDAEPIDQEVAAKDGYPSRTIFLYITPKTWERTLRELKHIGYPHPKLIPAALNPGTEKSFAFDEVDFLAECRHETYNQKDREQWSIYVPRVGAMSEEDVAQFESLFGEEPSGASAPLS